MTSSARDPGLQLERTALAWRRTLLAFAIGSLISMRVLSETLGGWAIVVGVGGLLFTGVLWVLLEYRQPARAGSTQRRLAFQRDGLLLAAVAGVSMLGAAFGLLDLLGAAAH